MKEALIELFPFKDGMNWMAVDEDGSVYQYSAEPTDKQYPDEWYPSSTSNDWVQVGEISPPKDWTTTLVKREEWKLSESQVVKLREAANDFIYEGAFGTTLSNTGILEIINMYEQFKSKA